MRICDEPAARSGAVVAVVGAMLLADRPRGRAPRDPRRSSTTPSPMTLSGIVTLVDWANPHVHVFVNVQGRRRTRCSTGRWSSKARSTCSRAAGTRTRCEPGDAITVQGIVGAQRQPAGVGPIGRRERHGPTGAQRRSRRRRRRRWRRGRRRVGPTASRGWAPCPGPTATGASRAPRCWWRTASRWRSDAYGLLHNIADASKVAPMQPWALGLYQNRQRRFLQDDPTFLNCKPPGGPRQFQQRYGVQFVEDRDASAHLRADRRRQPQLPHHLHRRPRPQGPGGRRRRQPALLRPRGGQVGGRARSWSIPAGSTRISGSPTAGCRTRTSCGWSSGSRGPISTRCDTR